MKRLLFSALLILIATAVFSQQKKGSGLLVANAKDADGHVTSVKWEVVSGPTGWSFSDPAKDSTVFTVTQPGDYVLNVTVTDNEGGFITGVRRVKGVTNLPPTIDAGPAEQIIRLTAANTTFYAPGNQNSVAYIDTETGFK